MIKIALRDVWAHATRFILTILSVVLGVAFLSGTLALRATLEDTFLQSFSATTSGTVQVEGKLLAKGSEARAQISPDTADKIRGLEGVADAQPVHSRRITILQDGSPATGVGPMTLAIGTLDGFTPWTLDGAKPYGTGQIAFEEAALKRYGFNVGDQIEYLAAGERKSARITAVVHLAAPVSPLNVISFDTQTVRSFQEDPNLVDVIAVQTKEGADPASVAERIEQELGSDYTVRTRDQVIEDASKTVEDRLGFITAFLLVFIILALGVSTFIITNTFRMAVKARQKEFAYLRAIGASPAQIFWQVALQALVIGVVGSLLGVAAGIGLLALTSYGLMRIGMVSELITTLPSDVTLISLIVGTAVTLVGAILPARAAAQTPPVEAMREVSGVREPSLKPRAITGTALILLGAVGVYIGGTHTVEAAGTALGVGSAAVVIGALIASPAFAKHVINLLALPLRKTGSVTIRVGAGNAIRNPRRTASTAGALIIGMALVTLGTVLASSVQASTTSAVQSELKADFTVSAVMPGEPISDETVNKIRQAPGVASVNDSYNFAFGHALKDEETAPLALTTVDLTTLQKDFDIPMESGDLETVRAGKIVLSQTTAQALQLGVGDTIYVLSNEGPTTLKVGGIHKSMTFAGTSLVSETTLEGLNVKSRGASFITLFKEEAADLDEVQANVRQALSDVPTLAVYSKADMVSEIGSAITTTLGILYALLALSIIVAIVGIVNTLSLAVSERTTEIALMRAIGTSKSQMRSTIIVEAVLTSLYGTIVGILIGLGTGIGLVRYTSDVGINVLSIPWGSLALMLAGTILIGVLAALGPARRAARLPILDAIASE